MRSHALLWLGFQTRDSRGIYLPNHIELFSHIAVDVRIAVFPLSFSAKILHRSAVH